MSQYINTNRSIDWFSRGSDEWPLYEIPPGLQFTSDLIGGMVERFTPEGGYVPREEQISVAEAVAMAKEKETQGRHNVAAAIVHPDTSVRSENYSSYGTAPAYGLYPDEVRGELFADSWLNKISSGPNSVKAVDLDELGDVYFKSASAPPERPDGSYNKRSWGRDDAVLVYAVEGFDGLPDPMARYFVTAEHTRPPDWSPSALELAKTHDDTTPRETAAAINVIHETGVRPNYWNPNRSKSSRSLLHKRLALTRAFDTLANAPDVAEAMAENDDYFPRADGSLLKTDLARDLPPARVISHE